MTENNQPIKKRNKWKVPVIIGSCVLIMGVIFAFIIGKEEDHELTCTLAPESTAFLENDENFKSPVSIKVYLSGDFSVQIESFRKAIEDKLVDLKQHAINNIEFQFVNPNLATEEEQRDLKTLLFNNGKGILPLNVVYRKDDSTHELELWPGATIEYRGTVNSIQFIPASLSSAPVNMDKLTEIIETCTNNLEYTLMNSLRMITRDHKPKIAFLQGHGELEFKDTQHVRAILSPFYTVTDIALNDSLEALDEVDGLIIARPTKPFSDKDLYIIDQFVMNGGRLMCFIDKLNLPVDSLNKYGQTHTTRYDLKIDKMLFDYGIKITDSYILDAQCAVKNIVRSDQSIIPWFYHVMATNTSHPVSTLMEPVSLEYTSELQYIRKNSDVTFTPLLTSSTNSTKTGLAPKVNTKIADAYGVNPKLADDPKSEANKKYLAGVLEGTFTSYFKNRIATEFANDPTSNYKEKSTKNGKVLVIGNGRWIANKYDSIMGNQGTMRYRPIQLNDLRYNEEMTRMQINHAFSNEDFFRNITDYMFDDYLLLEARGNESQLQSIDTKQKNNGGPLLLFILLGIGLISTVISINNSRKLKIAH